MSLNIKGSTYTVNAAGFANTITLSEAELDGVHRPLTATDAEGRMHMKTDGPARISS